ncbi:unnamed protein product, partial [marine sediment metagenome]
MAKRMSTRSFNNSAVSDQLLSNVLWAAYGYTPEGKRTIDLFDNSTIIYVCRQDAAYKYIPENHSLQLWKAGDYSYVGQSDTAQVKICLVYDDNKATEYPAMAEIGKVGQNIYLQSISNNLGTVTTGTAATECQTALELPQNEHSKIIMPLGYPSVPYDFSNVSLPASNLPEVEESGVGLEHALSTLTTETLWSSSPINAQE